MLSVDRYDSPVGVLGVLGGPAGLRELGWGLVTRGPDPLDARARRVLFTADGLAWLEAFRKAVAQAENEFRASVGDEIATVVTIGLEAYAGT